MEKYLKEEYNIFEDENYLKNKEDIEDYFKDDYGDLLDCGQGYYQDKANVICKIGEKFYNVTIQAEIGSAKQDYGDRLYWVEGIKSVVYEEIEKPKPKEKFKITYNLELTEYQRKMLENFFEKNYIICEILK